MGAEYMGKISKMLGLAVLIGAAAEAVCYSHVESKCSEPGESWSTGGCNSVHGGFLGNSNNLHRIIVDDFTDSITYLLMSSNFNTDSKNHMGFHKYFMGKSDKMWNGFQVPPLGQGYSFDDFDFTNEMKSFGVSLDLLKARAEDTLTAYMHSYNRKSDDSSFDPTTAHMLEE